MDFMSFHSTKRGNFNVLEHSQTVSIFRARYYYLLVFNYDNIAGNELECRLVLLLESILFV